MNTSDSEKTFSITEVTTDGRVARDDQLAVEEPLEIRVVSGPGEKRKGRSISITMRTPGNDFELAAGFLFTEGIIANREMVDDIEFCGPKVLGTDRQNIVRVYISENQTVDLSSLQRNFYMTSSCGVCGKASLDAVEAQRSEPVQSNLQISRETIYGLPKNLRAAQAVFKLTGGIHAAGLFKASGELASIREDIGRHNAVDKLIGQQFLAGVNDLRDFVIVVSGRASFELVQKSAIAGIPMLIAVGAPSSLAVELAERFQMTMVGFTSQERFNVYTGLHRILD